MAIRKSDDIANESGDEYAKSKSTIKVENITERFDDTTHNDNPYDDVLQYINKKLDECVDEINLSDSSKVITSDQAAAIRANTAKTGTTSTERSRITANHAKVGITTSQASAITANTNKTGITTSQASAISTNTSKTGITSGQSSAITANTAKVGTTSTERSRIAANHAKVGISTVQAAIVNNLHLEGGALIPTTTEKHTVSFSVEKSRSGVYSLVFTMVDGSGKTPVTKTAKINLS